MRTLKLRVETFDSEGMFGYKQITTFFSDFSIADRFGVSAIRDTYRRAFAEWKGNYKYLTELVMVLCWKCGIFSERGNDAFAQTYRELFEKANDYAWENLKDDELSYFYHTTN